MFLIAREPQTFSNPTTAPRTEVSIPHGGCLLGYVLLRGSSMLALAEINKKLL